MPELLKTLKQKWRCHTRQTVDCSRFWKPKAYWQIGIHRHKGYLYMCLIKQLPESILSKPYAIKVSLDTWQQGQDLQQFINSSCKNELLDLKKNSLQLSLCVGAEQVIFKEIALTGSLSEREAQNILTIQSQQLHDDMEMTETDSLLSDYRLNPGLGCNGVMQMVFCHEHCLRPLRNTSEMLGQEMDVVMVDSLAVSDTLLLCDQSDMSGNIWGLYLTEERWWLLSWSDNIGFSQRDIPVQDGCSVLFNDNATLQETCRQIEQYIRQKNTHDQPVSLALIACEFKNKILMTLIRERLQQFLSFSVFVVNPFKAKGADEITVLDPGKVLINEDMFHFVTPFSMAMSLCSR